LSRKRQIKFKIKNTLASFASFFTPFNPFTSTFALELKEKQNKKSCKG
jgi:hypothetical protein